MLRAHGSHAPMGFPSFVMLMTTQTYGARAGPICGVRTGLAMPKKIVTP